VKRRAFVLATALACALPLRAQEARRVSALIGFGEDADMRALLAVFVQSLAARGWRDGGNMRLDVHWTGGDPARSAALARELVAAKPDVLVSYGTAATAALQKETRSIPIVFGLVSDPVGSGFIKSLARPGGNMTGLVNFESSLAEKWLQLLKEMSPRTVRVAVMFNPKTAPFAPFYLTPIEAAAPKMKVASFPSPVESPADIERVIAELGRRQDSGLVVMTDPYMVHSRQLLADLALRHKVPSMYFYTQFVQAGGLISYSVDIPDLISRGTSYVDRILRGARPEDLPVEQPTKFELVVNRTTAKALNLSIPQSILTVADRVFE